MNKEQPIKGKEEILDFWYETGMHWKSSNRYNVLKAMEEYKNQFTTPIQSGEERWISVEEKPEENKWVLLYNGHWIGVGRYSPDKEREDDLKHPAWHDETTEWITPEPTHWQPLPKPPNGEQKSNAGEERLFTLEEGLDIWNAGYERAWYVTGSRSGKPEPSEKEYFKEKFGILLSSEQNVQASVATEADQGGDAGTKK